MRTSCPRTKNAAPAVRFSLICNRGSAARSLIGTWADAAWAIAFYERHGFTLAPEDARGLLLRTYWSISARQIETSVVLAQPAVTREGAGALASAQAR